MTLKLFNTLTRKKEEFKPIKKGEVGLYSCGPTVYNFAHIGNFRSYIFVDLLKRYLEYKGYKVKHIMNITDIDDKTIRDSEKENMQLKEFTEKYTKAFFQDIKTLNIKPASIFPKATEHIKDMLNFVRVLIKKGFAYEKLNSVYFSIKKFKDYGKLSKVDLSQMKPGARVDLDEYEKAHPGDFTLLKRSKLDELKKGIYYDTEFGKVRPGWHLECSVMSMKYLGDNFDIHTGGVDLIFPHHENEIAQSEAYSGKKFVNYWLHNKHLIVNGEKMSKSAGNFFTLRDLLNKGYDPMAIRYELISTQYRQKLDFREKDMENAKNTLQKFKELFIKLDNVKSARDNPKVEKLIQKVKTDFEKNMDDDLNIAAALSAVFVFIREINKIIENISKKDAKKIKQTLLDFDSVLGIISYQKEKIPEEIKQLAEQRLKARKEKDWEKADKLREEIKKKGFVIDDTVEGYILKKI